MDEIVKYFCSKADVGEIRPSQIAVVGDRLLTDIMMANMMGAWGVWVKDGVVIQTRAVSHLVFEML